jgi:RHS repeat-associated protein
MYPEKITYYQEEGLAKNYFFSGVSPEKRVTEHFFGLDYYPYGKLMDGRNYSSGNSEGARYQFTGHEFDGETMFGYHGARYYNRELGRYMSLDPLQRDFTDWTPYNYTIGNPLRLIDPDGRSPVAPNDGDKETKKKAEVDPDNGTLTSAKDNASTNAVDEAKLAELNGNVNVDYVSKIGEYVRSQAEPNGAKGPNGLASGAAESVPFFYDVLTLGGGKLFTVAAKKLLKKTITKESSTIVGRWMSKAEYETMVKTGRMVEGAGGQTFVGLGGPKAFNAASKGSVYAEFGVPTSSLLQGGKANWLKVIGPNAGNAMKGALGKQGGQLLPPIQNLSPILNVK